MIEDRLYRLTIPGTVFVALLAGWFVVDPTINFLGVLKELKVEGTAPLSVMVLGGGVVLIFMGYICGEIGLALGIPEPTPPVRYVESPAPSEPDRVWCKLSVFGGIVIVEPIVGTWLFYAQCDWIGWSVLSVCAIGLAWFYKLVKYIPCLAPSGLLDSNYNELEQRLHLDAGQISKNRLEAISVYSHGPLTSKNKQLGQYLSRAWGRTVIGTYSSLAVLLAASTYCGIKAYVSCTEDRPWRALWTIQSEPSCGELLYLLGNAALLIVLFVAGYKQSQHRIGLYEVMLGVKSRSVFDKDDTTKEECESDGEETSEA